MQGQYYQITINNNLFGTFVKIVRGRERDFRLEQGVLVPYSYVRSQWQF